MTTATEKFKPHEIETLAEVFDDYFRENIQLGHRCFLKEELGSMVGFVYHAPAPMTLGSWHLYWIVVDPQTQGKGHGGELLKFVEADIAKQGGKVLFIETSSTAHYEPTRKFYLKHGYEWAAQLKDFYCDGDDMVIFRKRVAPAE